MALGADPLLLAVEGISGTDGTSLIACLALAAATLVFIFLIDPDPSDSAPHRSHLDSLLERRDTIYENLRDLKFEHRAGKFSDQDYKETNKALENEATLVLAQIENVTGGPAHQPRRDATSGPSNSTPGEKPST